MKSPVITLENLIEVLKKCTASHVHIYIPFDDLIIKKKVNKNNCTYYLIDKHVPQDSNSAFVSGRNYLEVYISDDLEWVTCKAFSATNHLKGIQTIMSFFN